MRIEFKQLAIYIGVIGVPLVLIGMLVLNLSRNGNSEASIPPNVGQEQVANNSQSVSASAVPQADSAEGSSSNQVAAQMSVDGKPDNPKTSDRKHSTAHPKVIEHKPASLTTVPIKVSARPWGEVYLDGKMQGISPPLTTLKVVIGKHTIEIRNTTFPAYTQNIQVRVGEEVKVQHIFSN